MRQFLTPCPLSFFSWLFLFSWLVFSSLGYSLISSDGPHIEPLQPFTLLFFLLLACCFGKRARQKKRPISMNFCHIGLRGVVWPIMDFWCIFYGDYVEILWIFCVDFVFFLCFLCVSGLCILGEEQTFFRKILDVRYLTVVKSSPIMVFL